MTAPFRPDLRQPRRDPAQGPPESARKFAPARKSEKRSGRGALQERRAMKRFSGWVVSAGLVLTAATASAQGVVPRDLAPYQNGGARYAPPFDIAGPSSAMAAHGA